MEQFRNLTDANEEPLIRNFRKVQHIHECCRNVFHVNPSPSQYATLLPVPSGQFTFKLSGNFPKPLLKESDTLRNFHQQQLNEKQQVFRVDAENTIWNGKKKSKRMRKEV